MSKRIVRLRHTLYHALELPAEAEGLVRVQLFGRERMSVENHKGVYEYRTELVRLQTGDGMLRVEGEGLSLQELQSERICISGTITGFFYEAQGR